MESSFKKSFCVKAMVFCLPFVSWNIWKERNNKVFRNKEMLEGDLHAKIVRAIKENLSLIPRKIVEKANWSPFDFAIAEKWNSKLIGVNVLKPVVCRRENASWLLPPLGWVKANFDGTAKGNPGKVGSRCVLRTTWGLLL